MSLKKRFIPIAAVSTAAAFSLCNPALAQGTGTGGQDALMTYHQADPFAPLPQFSTRRDSENPAQRRIDVQRSAGTHLLGRPSVDFNALSTYYQSDPLAPLPQFWGMHHDRKAAQDGTIIVSGRKDVLGRPFVDLDPQQFYYQTEPFGLEPRILNMRKGARGTKS